jgi:tetratricopeptide (TPR) repeat protein
MQANHCHYHPAQPATWHCEPCARFYGDCCAPLNAEAPHELPRCPLCSGELSFLGAANTAQPFWQRIPQFFGYALQRGPLAFAVLLALAGLFMPRSLILWILLFSVATKYFYSVIEAASQGQRQAPGLLAAFSLEGIGLFFRQLAVFLLAFIALAMVASLGSEALFWVANLAILLLMPASIICLALDKELGAALSPGLIWRVVRAMGWRYLILCAFLFILWQSPAWFTYMLSSGLPAGVLLPVAALLFDYFSVVMCAMMGYAVFQYQGALGYAVAEEDSQKYLPEAEWRRRRALAEAEILFKEGRREGAVEALSAALRRSPEDLALRERYHRLLFALGATERCLGHLARYLPLVARLNPALAANALLDARRLKADYLPHDPQVCEQVAEALLARHKTREALSLLVGLHQRFPDYPHIPRAYLLAARAFAEGLGQIDSAQKLLRFIRARYPQAPQTDELAALEQTLARLATVAG